MAIPVLHSMLGLAPAPSPLLQPPLPHSSLLAPAPTSPVWTHPPATGSAKLSPVPRLQNKGICLASSCGLCGFYKPGLPGSVTCRPTA